MRPLDFRTLGSLEFAAPDVDTFRCLSLARHAGEVGGTLPAVMNAANEVAVALFLEGTIGFLDIYEMCAQALRDQPFRENPTIQEILEIDAQIRRRAAGGVPPA